MNHFPPVLYRGSVKNVRGEVSAPNLLFEFSDRYSVFDWGEMPDQIDGKGVALASMGKAFFHYLEKPSHWSDLFVDKKITETFSSDFLKKLEESFLLKEYAENGLPHHALAQKEKKEWGKNFLAVKNISVLRPPLLNDGTYDYSAYKNKPTMGLVPLEIIFRMGLSHGNSLSKRLGNDLAKWKAFGFSTIPSEGEFLKMPMIDFSTKLERGDRYLSYEEAQRIAGLSDFEWHNLQQMAQLVALNLFRFHAKIDLDLWDGKIEVAFAQNEKGERSFMLVDSIGIDELRLLYKGKSFSKEFLRETYKNSAWYSALEAAKKEALIGGIDFKLLCIEKYKATPDKLDPQVKARAEAVYKSYANAVCAELKMELPFPSEFNLANYSERYL